MKNIMMKRRNLKKILRGLSFDFKNIYNDTTIYKRFVIGIDRAKMRLYDCEQSAQNDLIDTNQEEEYTKDEKLKSKSTFADFKF